MTASGKELQAITDMLSSLKSPETRRVFQRLFTASGYFKSTHVVDDQGGRKSAFESGRREVGIWLKEQIDKADPEAFARLLSERR